MSIRMGLIQKKPDWSSDSFSSHWRMQHAALAARAPKLREYWQNEVTERLQRGIDFTRGPWDFDGFSQLSFNDPAQADTAFKDGELAAALIKDETYFLGNLHIVIAEQRVVIAVPQASRRGALLKRISTLKRRGDVSEDDFRREWLVHADFVRRMPGVAAYRQNVVVAREAVKGIPCGYEDLPIDGIVELWFANPETLEAAFSSVAGQKTMAHAKTFLGEITAFQVEERRIV